MLRFTCLITDNEKYIYKKLGVAIKTFLNYFYFLISPKCVNCMDIFWFEV